MCGDRCVRILRQLYKLICGYADAVFIDVHKDLNPQEVLSAIERGEFSIIGENLELTSTPKNNQKSLPAAKSQGLISINDTAQCFSPQTVCFMIGY